MAKPKVRLHSPGVVNLLKDAGVRDELTRRMERVEAQARANAPVDTGAYRDSITLEQDTTDRAVVRVVAHAGHALLVESHTGNLARALDAAGGEGKEETELIDYVTRAGKRRKATRKQVAAWTRGRG